MASTLKLIVDPSCINCDDCSKVCPAMAGQAGPAIVRGRRHSDPIRINAEACVECGYCVDACTFRFISAVKELSEPEAAPAPVSASEGAGAEDNPTGGGAAPVAPALSPSANSTPRKRGKR
jgi:Fe-S-cluster-containing hydrogenase component 2